MDTIPLQKDCQNLYKTNPATNSRTWRRQKLNSSTYVSRSIVRSMYTAKNQQPEEPPDRRSVDNTLAPPDNTLAPPDNTRTASAVTSKCVTTGDNNAANSDDNKQQHAFIAPTSRSHHDRVGSSATVANKKGTPSVSSTPTADRRPTPKRHRQSIRPSQCGSRRDDVPRRRGSREMIRLGTQMWRVMTRRRGRRMLTKSKQHQRFRRLPQDLRKAILIWTA
jgi:hypothetical protein